MQIFISTVRGSLCFEICEGMTVGQIKDLVAEKINTVSQNISLIHSGTKWEMNDHKLTAQDLTELKKDLFAFTAVIKYEPKSN